MGLKAVLFDLDDTLYASFQAGDAYAYERLAAWAEGELVFFLFPAPRLPMHSAKAAHTSPGSSRACRRSTTVWYRPSARSSAWD